MAKNNRRRRVDRAKRQARASQKRAAAHRRQAAKETIRDALERYDRLVNPSTPATELAALLGEQYGGEPVSTVLVDRMLANGSPPERLAGVAEVMLAAGASGAGSPSLTALTFAAAAARSAGDATRARELLDQALTAADDPEVRVDLAQHLRVAGRLADALELLEARLRVVPDDDHAAERYGTAIEEAYAHVSGLQPGDVCLCGQDGTWQECCEPRIHAALRRFADRSALVALSDAVTAFLTISEYGRAVEDRVAEWLPPDDDLDCGPAEVAALCALAAEHALLTAGLSADEELEDQDLIGSPETGDADTPLVAFAADPSTPPELAGRANVWREHIRYGLWRVDGPPAAPGLWCTDINSGVVQYAEFPADLANEMPRWAVWMGGLVPVDGIWRATGAGFRLSPAEGDAAAELVQAAVSTLVHAMAGKKEKRPSKLRAEALRVGRAEPHGVYVDWEDPASPQVAELVGKVTGVLLPRIVAEVQLHRRTPPALRNTDGDEMCLITAEIKVSDTPQAARQLVGRPGFERDAGDPARIVWYGLRVPDAQQAAMLAEARAQLSAQGRLGAEIEDSITPQRWVRGTLQVGDGHLVAEVNSRRRLARLLDVLTKLGANPVVTEEKRIDPAQDFAWSRGEHASPGGAAPPTDGWEKHWLDEHVPALRGRTPRQAARGKERPLLEALLRQFEYEADLLAATDKPGVDTGWLRQELGMTTDLEG